MKGKNTVTSDQLKDIQGLLVISKNIIETSLLKYKDIDVSNTQNIYLNYLSRIYSNLIAITILIQEYKNSDYLAQSYLVILRSGLLDFIQIQYLFCIYSDSNFKSLPETETLGIYYSQAKHYKNELNIIEKILNQINPTSEELDFIKDEREEFITLSENLKKEDISLDFKISEMLETIASNRLFSQYSRVYIEYHKFSKVDHSGVIGHKMYQYHDDDLINAILYSLIIHHQSIYYLLRLIPNDNSHSLEIQSVSKLIDGYTTIMKQLNPSK